LQRTGAQAVLSSDRLGWSAALPVRAARALAEPRCGHDCRWSPIVPYRGLGDAPTSSAGGDASAEQGVTAALEGLSLGPQQAAASSSAAGTSTASGQQRAAAAVAATAAAATLRAQLQVRWWLWPAAQLEPACAACALARSQPPPTSLPRCRALQHLFGNGPAAMSRVPGQNARQPLWLYINHLGWCR